MDENKYGYTERVYKTSESIFSMIENFSGVELDALKEIVQDKLNLRDNDDPDIGVRELA